MKFRQTVAVALLLLLVAVTGYSQTANSGDIAGAVTDPSGGVIQHASLKATNKATGLERTAESGVNGAYRISFLPLGVYTVAVSAPGFQNSQKTVTVTVGQISDADFPLAVAAAGTTVTVTETVETVQKGNAEITTTITPQEFDALPNSGGDITYFALTAPGMVMNTQAGYGNLVANGLPGTSNAFAMNGQSIVDPYINIVSTGATDMTLGANEIAEVTVVENGYSGENGQMAGAHISYATKSGSNSFHGNAIWSWNGRALNANNFFNNSAGIPRPFENSNQWADSLGGPIRKNKTFFFFNNEGLRVMLPTNSTLVKVPSQQFQQATLNNLVAMGNAYAVPYYQKIFSVYTSSPGYSSATPVAGGGCGAFTALGAGVPCAMQFRTAVGSFTNESQVAARVDHSFNDNDKVYGRYWKDSGFQPSITDPLNATYSVVSRQPSYTWQLGQTHTFSSTMINQFNASVLHYAADFVFADPATQAAGLVTPVGFSGSLFTAAGGSVSYLFPQGRHLTQFQYSDDLSKTRGAHTLKFGVTYRRVALTEADYGSYMNGRVNSESLTDFYNGVATTYQQRFPSGGEQGHNLFQVGFYGQDDWAVTRKLNLSLSLRGDYASNPTCKASCYSMMTTPFTQLSHDASVPYSSIIQVGRNNAYLNADTVIWQPRGGFTYAVAPHTVLRGGIGLFGDGLPANLVHSASFNSPEVNAFVVSGSLLAPGAAQSGAALTTSSNASFVNAFTSGKTVSQIQTMNPSFVLPSYSSFESTTKVPRYLEWNFEIQQELPGKAVLSVNYVGNHGWNEMFTNDNINAYCSLAVCPNGFKGLPSSAPDPRFGTVSMFQSIGRSNYDGLTSTLFKRYADGLSFSFSHTWSHALDMVSDGGLSQANGAFSGTDPSVLEVFNPSNPNQNYGSGDLDVRQNFSARFTWDNPLHRFAHGPAKLVLNGWNLAGTFFARSGLPFTVVDSDVAGGLSNYGLAFQPGGGVPVNIVGSPSTSCSAQAVDVPCLSASAFQSSPNGFGSETRNLFRGPRFIDVDMSVGRDFAIRERMRLGVSAQFYNLFNHPNFDQPVNDIAAGSSFGMIQATVSTPTSIVGSFIGGDASPRLIQLSAKLKF